MTTILMIAFGVGAMLALAGVGFQAISWREGRTKPGWPAAKATVVSSCTGLQRSGTSSFDRFSVNFTYEVAGAPFDGLLYSDKPKNFLPLAQKYEEGGVFDVFYNPAKPAHVEARDPLARMGVMSPALMAYVLYFLAVVVGGVAWVISTTPPPS
jgi:Protein of unknown function (DUF3592)